MRRALLLLALVAAALHVRADDGTTTGRDDFDYAVDVDGFLYEIDVEHLTHRKLGQVQVQPAKDGEPIDAPQLCDLAATPDGYLFGISRDALYLIKITNPADSMRIGSHGVANTYGMGGGPKGEILVNTVSGDVYTIDAKTAKATLLGKMGGGFVASGDIALVVTTVAGQQKSIVVSSVKDAARTEHLVTLDPKTGKATHVGPFVDENGLPINDVYGLICRKEILYALTHTGEILHVDPFTAKCKLLKATGKSWWGATDYHRF